MPASAAVGVKGVKVKEKLKQKQANNDDIGKLLDDYDVPPPKAPTSNKAEAAKTNKAKAEGEPAGGEYGNYLTSQIVAGLNTHTTSGANP